MLKTSWPIKTLGEICEIYQPQTIGSKDMVPNGPYVVFGANGPIGHYDRFNHENSEVTVTCRGATCGTVNVTPSYVWITGNAMVVRPNEEEMSKLFLKYWLEGLDYSSVITGAAQPQITRTTLSPLKIPVPPLDEQKRIVALLDAASVRVAELSACYEQAHTNANNLFNSVLRDELQSNPDWPTKRLDEISEVRDGTHDSPRPADSGFPLVTSKNIRNGRISLEGSYLISAHDYDQINRRSKVDKFDVLISMIGTVGEVCLATWEPDFAIKNVGLIKTGNESLSRFLVYFLISPAGKGGIRNSESGTTQRFIGLGKLRGLEIQVPPLDEQMRIVARLDSMRAKTSEMVAAFDAKLIAAKNLRQSILEAAFAGEL